MASLSQSAVLVELLNCAVGNETPPEQQLCEGTNLIGAKQLRKDGSESGSTASGVLCSRPCRGGPRPGIRVAWLALAGGISQEARYVPTDAGALGAQRQCLLVRADKAVSRDM